MEEEKQITREENPAFFKLWDLKCVQKWKEGQEHLKGWPDFEIYAKTTKDLTMSVWNGRHEPSVKENCVEHVCKAGTRVRVWMVSRFGDVGVTDNMVDPRGYDIRGLDADTDLKDYEFIERK